MITFLRNIFWLPLLFKRLLRSTKLQKRFLKETVFVDIELSKQDNDSTLSEKDFRKIRGYYGFAVPALLGEGFCMLRGRAMSEKERYAITYLGALTGLFDDFFDEKNMSEAHIMDLMNTPEDRLAKNANERLFAKFYRVALQNSPDIQRVKDTALLVFNAQVNSRKQLLSTISNEEIQQITYDKGGLSLLFYRGVFQEDIDDSEKSMLYHLGAIGQLENDIFDIYKDDKNGVHTLATRTKKIKELRQTYTQLMNQTFQLVHQTRFASRNKKEFARFISFIISRGFVALDFLEKNERNTHKTFVLRHYDKKDLICDMGKLSNSLKLIWHYGKTNVKHM